MTDTKSSNWKQYQKFVFFSTDQNDEYDYEQFEKFVGNYIPFRI